MVKRRMGESKIEVEVKVEVKVKALPSVAFILKGKLWTRAGEGGLRLRLSRIL
jgi:hypothetical protein